MEDDVTRVRRYRALAEELEVLARIELDDSRRRQLARSAAHYRKIADDLIEEAA